VELAMRIPGIQQPAMTTVVPLMIGIHGQGLN
jgi:hypothetical protein